MFLSPVGDAVRFCDRQIYLQVAPSCPLQVRKLQAMKTTVRLRSQFTLIPATTVVTLLIAIPCSVEYALPKVSERHHTNPTCHVLLLSPCRAHPSSGRTNGRQQGSLRAGGDRALLSVVAQVEPSRERPRQLGLSVCGGSLARGSLQGSA